MKRLTAFTMTSLLLLLATSVGAEVLVVVNAGNPVDSISRRELVDIYMGRVQYFSDGSRVLRLDQTPESSARTRFYRQLVNKSVVEVNAYWAKLLFTGRASPPQVEGSDQAVLDMIRSNKNAIGYIMADEVDDTVKVVARVN